MIVPLPLFPLYRSGGWAARLCAVTFALGLVVCLALPGSTSAAEAPPELYEGVDQVLLPGVVGSISVFGPEAFAVASAAAEGGQLPFIAAGPCGKGRIVACGHNGYMSPDSLKSPSTGRLMKNLMHWAATSTARPAGEVRIGVIGEGHRGLARALQQEGLKAEVLTGAGWPGTLGHFQLVIAEPRKLEPAHVAPLLAFARQGGGLYLADAGWVWEGYSAKPGEVLRHDYIGNQIGQHAGLMWSLRNVKTPADKHTPAPPAAGTALDCHTALQVLRKAPAAGGDDHAKQQALVTLENTLALLPVDDKLFRPEFERALQSERPNLTIPRVKEAVRGADLFGRLQVANETRKVLDAPVDKLQAHPYAEVFPGLPPANAKPVRKKIAIDTQHPRWHGTGLFARAGDVVRVTVPKEAAGQGLIVRIGPHKDRLWHLDKWQRAPEVTRSFAITEPMTRAGSGFGGLLYIEVPNNCKLGRINVEIANAIPAPLYVHGETSQQEWRTVRERPAPWAELASSKFIITLPSEAIRALDRPDELMDYWDRVLDTCADLATIPHERAYPERFVIDAQISAGYMHAGYPIMAPLNLAGEVTDLATLQRKGNWGVYHEIGHNHQQPEWTWAGLTEVTVNLFSIHVLENINPGAPLHGAIQPDKLARMTREFERTGKLDGPFEQLMPYIQLRTAFGWEPFQQVFAEYRALPASERPKNTQERKDQWLVRFSRAVGKNLGPFYDSWKIGMSAEAKQKVSDLPEWMPPRFE